MKRIGILVLLAMVLVGCQAKTSQERVRIVLDWTPNTNHTGLYVALEKGYFKDKGLDVEIVQPPEDGTTALVAAGGAEFGVSFQDTLAPVFANKQTIPVTAVAALIQHNTSGLISLKEKGIDTPQKLENHTYATWDAPIEKAIIRNVMAKDHGNFDTVKLVPSQVTDVISALQTNIDAVWVFQGWDGMAFRVAGIETNFINFADFGSELDFYSPVLIANNTYLNEHAKQAKDVLSAVQKGYEFAIENPQDAADILMQHAPELQNNKELIYQSQQWLASQYLAEVSQWGRFDAARWNGFYKWLFDEKLIETQIPENHGFSNEFLAS